jgi:hypothetical protein
LVTFVKQDFLLLVYECRYCFQRQDLFKTFKKRCQWSCSLFFFRSLLSETKKVGVACLRTKKKLSRLQSRFFFFWLWFIVGKKKKIEKQQAIHAM